jgi:hypothetical protein
VVGRSRAPWLLVLGVPAVVGLAGLLMVLGFRSDPPDPVAVHWSTSGPNDGGRGRAAQRVDPRCAADSVSLTSTGQVAMSTKRE